VDESWGDEADRSRVVAVGGDDKKAEDQNEPLSKGKALSVDK
jgi:hypothetical protein